VPRVSNSRKIEMALNSLRKLTIEILDMDVNITLVPRHPVGEKPKPKPKIFEEDGCCKVHKDAWVDAGNSCPFCDGTQDYKDF